MGFVVGYKYDVFVSYARVNDHSGWVRCFTQRLQAVLNEKLRGQSDIFFDRSELPPNQQLTPTIRDAVGSSATLIAVLSDGYLASEWCREELRLFLESHQGLGGQVFLVIYDEVAVEDKPDGIREIPGYEFFRRAPVTRVCMPLDVQEREFDAKLYFLRSHLVEKLKQLSGASDASAR